jgi:hypothetical protein
MFCESSSRFSLSRFVGKRPLPDGRGTGKVTVDAAAVFLSRLDGGGLATFEATRYALVRQDALRGLRRGVAAAGPRRRGFLGKWLERACTPGTRGWRGWELLLVW